jgi:hypothetical protein
MYMRDDEKNAEVNALFEERHPQHVGAKNTIKWRSEIARELLEDESEDLKEDITRRIEEDYQTVLARHKSRGQPDEPSEITEEEKAEARGQVSATVQPLLDMLREYTGYHVTLLMGTVVDGKFDVRS